MEAIKPITTYGVRRRPSGQNRVNTLGAVMPLSPTGSLPPFGKRPYESDGDHGGAENLETRVPIKPKVSNKVPKPNSVEDLIVPMVYAQHVATLVDQVKTTEGRKSMRSQPNKFTIYDDSEKPQLYLRWLSSLGFKEELFGEGILYVIPIEKFKLIRAALSKTVYWSGDFNRTDGSESGSSDSVSQLPGDFADVKTKMAPSIVIPDATVGYAPDDCVVRSWIRPQIK